LAEDGLSTYNNYRGVYGNKAKKRARFTAKDNLL